MKGQAPPAIYSGHAGALPSHKKRFYADIQEKQILDVGCGVGQAARFLQPQGNTLDAITWSEKEAELALHLYRHVYRMDVNDNRAIRSIRDKYDVILLGDVLEHLIRPLELLLELRSKLATDGLIYISVPNIANIVPRLSLLVGYFDYAPSGIMDSSHLHFFTKRSICRLVYEAGYEIIRTDYSNWNWSVFPQSFVDKLHLQSLSEVVRRMLTRLLPGLFATQIMLVVSPRANKALGAREGLEIDQHNQDVR